MESKIRSPNARFGVRCQTTVVQELVDAVTSGEGIRPLLVFHNKAWRLPYRDYLRTPLTHFATALLGIGEEFFRGLSPGARWQAKSKQQKLLKGFGENVIRILYSREPAELEN